MPERKTAHQSESAAEHAKTESLKAEKKEHKISSAEIAKGEKDLSEKRKQAEKKLAEQREKEEQEKQAEKTKPEKHDAEPKAKDPNSYSKLERKQAYRKEIKKVQAQLPSGARRFSKIVHNPVVEKVSDVSAKTVFRPSALVGGSLAGLVVGSIFYFLAKTNGYTFPALTIVALLILGALVGVVLEFIYKKLLRHND